MPGSFDDLMADLHSGDLHRRQTAAKALGELGDRRATSFLVGVLDDAAWLARQSAAEGLGRLGDSEAVEPLCRVLPDPVSSVRNAAAEALGRLKDPRSAEALVAALADPDRYVCGTVIWALSQVGQPAVPALIGALEDANWLARWGAADALGRIGAGEAVAPLRDRARHERHRGVRDACLHAAQRIGATLRTVPAELEAAEAPGGRGTELESSPPPAGRGTELEAAPDDLGD